jgi:hypothetical protein
VEPREPGLGAPTSLDPAGAAEPRAELSAEEPHALVQELLARAAQTPERQAEVARQRKQIDAQAAESAALGLDEDEHTRRLVERQRASINATLRSELRGAFKVRLRRPIARPLTRARGARPVRRVRRAPARAPGDPSREPEPPLVGREGRR